MSFQRPSFTKLRSKLSLGSLKADGKDDATSPKLVKVTLASTKEEVGAKSTDSNRSDRGKRSIEVSHVPSADSTYTPTQTPLHSKEAQVSLMSRAAFRKALDDPVSLHKFGQFLASELGAETLCFWLNAEQYRLDMMRLQSLGRRIHDLHVPTNAPLAINVSSTERNRLVDDMNLFFQLPDPFAAASEAAFLAMHADGWHRFVKHRLSLAQNFSLKSQSTTFTDSFCLADCQAGEDQPLVMISNGFEKLTGYNLEDALGTNCRFLQGAGTSKAAVERMRHACQKGLPSQELLLNYSKSGQPMWVLLRIEPLRDENGMLKYLMGHQFCVSKRATDLTYLLSDALDDHHDKNASAITPMAALHAQQAQTVTDSYISAKTANIARPDDRDRRLKDAAALAFDAQSLRPSSSAGKTAAFGTSGVPASSKRAYRPTSAAGGVLSSFGSAAREERRALSEIALIDAEESLVWQSQVLARFAVLEPKTHAILFSSPSLPSEFAQGCNFLSIISKQNPSEVTKQVKRALAEKDSTGIEAKVAIVQGKARPEDDICFLTITPLIEAHNKVGGIIVLFTL